METTKKKKCSKCGEVKPLIEFYVDKSRADGFCYECKECKLNRRKQYYQANRSKELEYGKTHGKQNRINQKRYYKKHQEKEKQRTNTYRKNNLNKKNAQSIAYYHKARLKKDRCELCGATENLIMHHPDYLRPKKVITLCSICHNEVHKANKLKYGVC